MRIFQFALIAVSAISMALTGCSNKQEAADKARIHYDIAYDLLQKGEMGQAISQIRQAVQINPNDPELFNLMGLIYMNRDLPKDAEDAFKQAIKIKPDYADVHNNLCGLYITQSLWDSAITECQKAADNITYPSPEKAYLNMGWAQYKMGDKTKAIDSFKKALLHRPGFYLAHQHLGTVYFDLSKYNLAIDNFSEAIKGCTFCAEPFYRLGLTYFKVNQKPQAFKSFRKCTELDKDGEIGKLCGNFIKKYEP